MRIGLRSGSGGGVGGGLRIDVPPLDVSEDSLEREMGGSGLVRRFDERGVFDDDDNDNEGVYDDETFYDDEEGFDQGEGESESGFPAATTGGGDSPPSYSLNDSAARELRALGFAVTTGRLSQGV